MLFFYGKMAPVVEPSGAGADHGAGEKAAAYRSRNYQLEMLEASMKENIIVAVGLFFFFFFESVLAKEWCLLYCRWIQGVGRPMCTSGPGCLSVKALLPMNHVF